MLPCIYAIYSFSPPFISRAYLVAYLVGKVNPAGPVPPAAKTTTVSLDMESNKVVLWAQTWLIDFTDAILIRICQFCLMLGFIAGTIAVLSTRYNINAAP